MQIGIGDLIISFSSGRGQIPEVYHNFFLNNVTPDLVLEFHYGKIPDFPVDEKIFDSNAIWSCYRSRGRYIFKDRPLTASSPNLVISIEPDFDSGDIYTNRPDSFPFRYPLDEIITINLLFRNHGILAHACGIDEGGKGILFLGNSSSGKSTLAGLWDDEGRATVLNDDRIIIRKINGHFWIYGTPWQGIGGFSSPGKAILEKIYILEQAQENFLLPLKGVVAVGAILSRCMIPLWDHFGMKNTLKFCDELIKKVPCSRLGFLPNESIFDLLKK